MNKNEFIAYILAYIVSTDSEAHVSPILPSSREIIGHYTYPG